MVVNMISIAMIMHNITCYTHIPYQTVKYLVNLAIVATLLLTCATRRAAARHNYHAEAINSLPDRVTCMRR